MNLKDWIKSQLEKSRTSVRNGFLKTELNKVDPENKIETHGLEKLYDENGQKVIPNVGDAALNAALFFEDVEKNAGIKRVQNYLKEGASPETQAAIDKINKDNFEIIGTEPSEDKYRRIVENTKKELSLPTDWMPDMEMRLTENPNLSKKKMNKIEENKIGEASKDPKPVNYLELGRPDAGDWGHFNDVAIGYGRLLKRKYPEMTEEEINKNVANAMLHDYGKLTVGYRDVWSKANSRTDEVQKNPELKNYVLNKVRDKINPHDIQGAIPLSELGMYDAAKDAAQHHTDDSLLMAMDMFNALTGKRAYREPLTFDEALKEMQLRNVGNGPGKISQETFDFFKEAVEAGDIPLPENKESEMTDVYKTVAGNAIKDKGIQLWDVKNTTKLGNTLDAINNRLETDKKAIMGAPFSALAGYVYPRLSNKVKKDALIDLYKSKGDTITVANLMGNVLDENQIDKLFAANTEEIKDLYKY